MLAWLKRKHLTYSFIPTGMVLLQKKRHCQCQEVGFRSQTTGRQVYILLHYCGLSNWVLRSSPGRDYSAVPQNFGNLLN